MTQHYDEKILSEDEYNALSKIAESTKMDCWFAIDTINGIDYIEDLEEGVRMSIGKGVEMLLDGMVENVHDPFYGLSNAEASAFTNLVSRLNIKQTRHIKRLLRGNANA